MSYTPQFLDELKQRNSIEDIVSAALPLKRSGSNLSGLCPFHNEKTPSFYVFPRTESFFCFGCGAGGDVVSFVMKNEGLDYPGAIEYLAHRCGMTVPDRIEKHSAVRRDRVIAMNRDAARYFHEMLYSPAGAEGLAYLKKRELTDATIKHFGLGYADRSWGALSGFLRGKGYTDEEMKAGFLVGSSGNNVYDYFRGRVMFPIIDLSGNVVAFGGRALGDEKPKYINSSDTPAFKKSKNLFALNFAKKNKENGLIMCEGYMDVISLHQAGFTNAVATLGTAVNAEHARSIAAQTQAVMLAYDSDDAGKKATERAISALTEAGISVKVIDLGDSKDPDEFIKKNGKDAFALKLRTTKGRIDYQIEEIVGRYDATNPDQQQARIRELTDFVATIIGKPSREIYCRRIAEITGLSLDGIMQTVENKNAKRQKSRKQESDAIDIRAAEGYRNGANPDKVRFSDVSATEEGIIGILLVSPDLGKTATQLLSPKDFNTEFCRKVFELFLPYLEANEAPNISANEALSPREQSELARYIASRSVLTDNGEKVLRAYIDDLLEKNRRRSADALGVTDMDALAEYLKKIKEKKK